VSVETLGEAWNFRWKIHIRCLDDGRRGLKHKRCCDYRAELDMRTLVCTRGRDFPIGPDCGAPAVSAMRLPTGRCNV